MSGPVLEETVLDESILDHTLPCECRTPDKTPCPNPADWLSVCRGCRRRAGFWCNDCRRSIFDHYRDLPESTRLNWTCKVCGEGPGFLEDILDWIPL